MEEELEELKYEIKDLKQKIETLEDYIGSLGRCHSSDMKFVNGQIDAIANHVGFKLEDQDYPVDDELSL